MLKKTTKQECMKKIQGLGTMDAKLFISEPITSKTFSQVQNELKRQLSGASYVELLVLTRN